MNERTEYFREYGVANREKITERNRLWRKENPERAREATRRWRANNPEKFRLAQRRSNYRLKWGMELEEIEAMIEAQGGVCPICKLELVLGGKAGAHVDHDHDVGHIRGILCANCNTGLGKFKDSPEFLRAAADYLDGDEIT